MRQLTRRWKLFKCILEITYIIGKSDDLEAKIKICQKTTLQCRGTALYRVLIEGNTAEHNMIIDHRLKL